MRFLLVCTPCMTLFKNDTNTPITWQDSSQLKDLWRKICHNGTGMEFQDHRYWLRTYPNCIVGKELVNWLLRNGTISNRYPATGEIIYLHFLLK